MSNALPTVWLLKCPQCGDRIRVEVPPDAPRGEGGSARCSRGHQVLFGYHGVTVRLEELAAEQR